MICYLGRFGSASFIGTKVSVPPCSSAMTTASAPRGLPDLIASAHSSRADSQGLHAGGIRRRKLSAFLVFDQVRPILDVEIVAGHGAPLSPQRRRTAIGSSEIPHSAKIIEKSQSAVRWASASPLGDQPIKRLEVRVNRPVAFAAAVLEAFNIEDMDATAAIIDETSFLKFASDQGDAAALHAQHLREELLC